MNDTLSLRPAQPYEYHPFSNIWPILDGEAFEDFATDIAANGLQVPIVLYKDMILDGRNRERACVEAGVEPRYEQAIAKNDEAALELVMSLNQHRRHLTFQEKAFAAARYANIKRGGVRGNQHYLGKLSQDSLARSKHISVEDAAKKFDISTVSVYRARRIIKHGGEQLEREVRQGKVNLTDAAEGVDKKRAPGEKAPADKPRYGVPTVSRMPIIDISKRRVLTPQQVDPEFTGTPNEFTTKYGHVQLETAEERATNRFKEWTIHIRMWAKDWKDQGALSAIDVNWLRSPHQRDVDSFLDSYAKLAVVFDNIKAIRDKVKALKESDNS